MSWLEIWNKKIPAEKGPDPGGDPAVSRVTATPADPLGPFHDVASPLAPVRTEEPQKDTPEASKGSALDQRDEEEIERRKRINSTRHEKCRCSRLDDGSTYYGCRLHPAHVLPSQKMTEQGNLSRRIRLRGINGDIEGNVWESDAVLRMGRLAALEVVLDDTSVSRRHAEVRSTANGWRVCDLGSTNGTFINGTRLGPGEWPIHHYDVLRCGNVTLVVDPASPQ